VLSPGDVPGSYAIIKNDPRQRAGFDVQFVPAGKFPIIRSFLQRGKILPSQGKGQDEKAN
jgi:hypothetical protein